MKRVERKIALRCAVYTRVSTDSGLEQDFNSLDNQREASEAYIKSQAHEGWKLVRERYDDAGFSGGSMERPALQKLLDDVRARKIDVIVVWGWISARIRRRDRLQLSRNDPFVMARAMPALSRARRSRGKSRVDSFETRISCCGARAANHQGTTRPAPRAARRRSSGAGSRWPTAPRQQFPRSTSRSPSRRPEGGSRETVSIPSRIPGLQSGPRPLPALAGLVPEPVVVGGVGGTPSAPRGPPSATSFARPSPGQPASSACASAISGISGVGEKPSSAGASTAWASPGRPVRR